MPWMVLQKRTRPKCMRRQRGASLGWDALSVQMRLNACTVLLYVVGVEDEEVDVQVLGKWGKKMTRTSSLVSRYEKVADLDYYMNKSNRRM